MPGFHEYEKHDSEFNNIYKKSIVDKIQEKTLKTRIEKDEKILENILKKAKDTDINICLEETRLDRKFIDMTCVVRREISCIQLTDGSNSLVINYEHLERFMHSYLDDDTDEKTTGTLVIKGKLMVGENGIGLVGYDKLEGYKKYHEKKYKKLMKELKETGINEQLLKITKL